MSQQMTTGREGWRAALAAATLLALAGWTTAAASEVRTFRMQSRATFLAGTLDGIGVDPLGTLELADRADRVAEVGEPFLFAAARHPDGWVLGTGNAGKVLLLSRDGELKTLFEAPEPEIFAVWSDADGTVFAGSSPDGKVYRIAGGAAEPFFEPGDTYIWGLARDARGRLLVATGTEGKLWAVSGKESGEVLYDSDDTHLRAVKVLADGSVLMGTAGEGLILRLGPEGKARTLYDAAQPEVVAFAAADDGDCYAAVLASEASLVDLSAAGAKEKSADEEDASTGSPGVRVTVTAVADEAATTGSRPASFTGARSEVLRISEAGLVESVATLEDETVYSLVWHRDRLWVGTGVEGKLYSLRDRKLVLEKDVDERQVVALLEDDPGPAFATTNAAALYRVSSERERRGTYTSPALDAEQIASFGTLRWRGDLPRGTGLEFSFRSGMSSTPDRTWSAWTAATSGQEIALSAVPPGRYFQWRAEFRAADGRSPRLAEAAVSYRQKNLPPRINSLTVLDPGQILVPANFNPANQVFEPAHPNRDGIFTTLATKPPAEDVRFKTLWKRGYRTLRWEASDPNDDELWAALSFRPEGAEGGWLPVTDEVEEDHYNFDATVLPDGRYRFRLTVTDRRGWSEEEALVGEEISEPVLIDHTPPALGRVERGADGWSVAVEDALSPLREAMVSVDAGEWRPARPVDGLLDGRRETLRLAPAEPGQLVLLRLTDAAFNVVTFEVGKGAS